LGNDDVPKRGIEAGDEKRLYTVELGGDPKMNRQTTQRRELRSPCGDVALHELDESQIQVRASACRGESILERRAGSAPRPDPEASDTKPDPGVQPVGLGRQCFFEASARRPACSAVSPLPTVVAQPLSTTATMTMSTPVASTFRR
jgi:hypothetical protein